MNLKPKFWNADKIVSFSAILISLATMGVYIYQTHLIQKQQNASVMPYLMIGFSKYNDYHFVVQVKNDGLGPAFVEEVNVYYKGKKYENYDLPNFFRRISPMKDSVIINMTSNINNSTLIPANATINTIERSQVKNQSSKENIKQADKLSSYFWTEHPVELEIIYSTIYGERWKTRGGFTRPTKLDD
jgi:hypothetical protein